MPNLALVTADTPPPAATKKRRVQKPPEFLQADECARFFAVIDSPRDRAIFQLMYRAGLRVSEIGRLDLRDYDRGTERVMCRRLKGSNPGQHHSCRVLIKAMHAWIKVRGLAPSPLFPSDQRTGIKRSQLDRLMKRYGDAAGIPRKFCHCHIWKHTCATHIVDQGAGILDVQDWLGHKNIQSAAIYAHISNPRREELAEKLKDSWK